MKHVFPNGFMWGVATSAAQIEGSTRADGRGESIWDHFAATPGNIADGSNPDVACDHYRRWRGDIELLKELGVAAYRFSIAWPRVLPGGRGPVNTAGLDFYDALVDALVQADIEPFVTLYHWDLPQALQEAGGWAERGTADAFAEYAAVVAQRLGDRVSGWITHNEPWCVATHGHEQGEHAPGHHDPRESLAVAHHVLLSHGLATGELRRCVPDARVGIVLNLAPSHPATSSDADRDAARWFDGFFNRWYLDPVFRGRYPADAIADRVARGHLDDENLPFVRAGDMEVISVPLDFLGLNYYSRVVMKAGDNGEPQAVRVVADEALTDMAWEVFPEGLYETLLRLHRDYGPHAIFVTENGAAYADGPDARGCIADERRTEYLRSHFTAAARAITDGVPLHGYFVWSLLDNFEWAHGFTKRFGLYWVDYKTQKRIPKDSALWYRRVIHSNHVTTNDE
jgi:beta-glucosidase